MASIDILYNGLGHDMVHTEKFKKILEDHLQLYKEGGPLVILEIPKSLANRRRNDFYGLCNELNIPVWQHYVTLRINGYHHPNEYVPEHGVILYRLEPVELETLLRRYMTSNSSGK